MTNFKSLLSAIILAAGLLAGTQAQAVAYALEPTALQILSAVNQVGARLSQAQDRIVSAIQGASTAQTTAASESARLIADANTKTAADMKKLDAEIDFEPLDSCSVTALAEGGTDVTNNLPASSGRGSPAPTPTAGATKAMAAVLEIANGKMPAPAPELGAAMAANGACGTFAAGGLRAESCRGAGFSPGLSSGYPNADIRAETLFDGPQTSADEAAGINRKLTIRPDNSPERMAVLSFVRNLETPVELRTLSAAELNSGAGRTYMALRDTYDAAISLASKPLRDQESLITANKATLPVLRQLMKGQDGQFIVRTLDKTYPSWASDGISFAQLMSLEASRRYMNEDWHVRMAGATQRQLLAEQVQLQALQIWTQVSLLEKIGQLGIIQGAVAGSVLRAEKMPMLVAAYRAARKPGGKPKTESESGSGG